MSYAVSGDDGECLASAFVPACVCVCASGEGVGTSSGCYEVGGLRECECECVDGGRSRWGSLCVSSTWVWSAPTRAQVRIPLCVYILMCTSNVCVNQCWEVIMRTPGCLVCMELHFVWKKQKKRLSLLALRSTLEVFGVSFRLCYFGCIMHNSSCCSVVIIIKFHAASVGIQLYIYTVPDTLIFIFI